MSRRISPCFTHLMHFVHHVAVFHPYKKLHMKGYSHQQPQVTDIRNFKFRLQGVNKCPPLADFPCSRTSHLSEALSNHTQVLEGVVAPTCPRLLFIQGANQQQH